MRLLVSKSSSVSPSSRIAKIGWFSRLGAILRDGGVPGGASASSSVGGSGGVGRISSMVQPGSGFRAGIARQKGITDRCRRMACERAAFKNRVPVTMRQERGGEARPDCSASGL